MSEITKMHATTILAVRRDGKSVIGGDGQVTVGATVLALLPLAIHGGPLWRPVCFAQIGGLSLATVIELVLVKSFYATFVADLGILSWGPSTLGETGIAEKSPE